MSGATIMSEPLSTTTAKPVTDAWELARIRKAAHEANPLRDDSQDPDAIAEVAAYRAGIAQQRTA